MKHTPGPWRWWTSNSLRRLTSEAGQGGPDGGVLHAYISRSDGIADVSVSDADMHLIAAAPELYAALERARWLLRAICGTDGNYPDERDILQAATAALAKARGEST